MDLTALVLFLSVIFVAALVRSSIGFGDALIAMPLLVILISLRIATPISALMSTTIALLILSKSWKQLQFKCVWKLILGSVVGIPLGLFFLKGDYDNIMKIVLGILIIVFSIFKLMEPKLIKLKNNGTAYLFGFLGGLFGGAFNTSGPFIVIFATLNNWHPSEFRTTLQGYFLVSNILIITMHGLTGLWTKQVVILFLITLPVIFIATLMGNKLNHIIPKEKFDRLVCYFLIMIGSYLIFHNLTM